MASRERTNLRGKAKGESTQEWDIRTSVFLGLFTTMFTL